MTTKNEENWYQNYEALKAYILERGHLPDKHVVENRALLNWAKYNRKKIKAGTLDADKVQLFEEHLALRSNEHTGGRKPPHSAAQIAQRLRHSGVKMAEILGVLRYQKSYTAVPSKRN